MRMNRTKVMPVLLVLLICAIVFPSCTDTHITESGFDFLRRSEGHASENHISNVCFFDSKFLNEVIYLDGEYQYDYFGIFMSEVDRAFAWLSFSEEEYERAKELYYTSYLHFDPNKKTKSAGRFHFYCYDERYGQHNTIGNFPLWLTAFGYNDEERTLVFIGFYCDRKDESEYVLLAETDFGAFLEHFYGEWYDWKLSD